MKSSFMLIAIHLLVTAQSFTNREGARSFICRDRLERKNTSTNSDLRKRSGYVSNRGLLRP